MFLMFLTNAFAQTAATPETAAAPPGWMQFVPIVFMIAVFYFLVMRPQAKKAKEHQDFIGNLKRGDQVVTDSGILGRIEGMTDSVITLEIAEGTRIKILKSRILGSQAAAVAAPGKSTPNAEVKA